MSSAVAARIEAPYAPKGVACGMGCPFFTGAGVSDGLCPSAKIF